jgi:Glycosyl hydrolases family 18
MTMKFKILSDRRRCFSTLSSSPVSRDYRSDKMKKISLAVATLVVTILLLSTTSRADWPARVFAPYIYGQPGALIQAYNATGQKYFTLAFTTASGRNRRQRNGASTGPSAPPVASNPSFSGHPMSDHFLAADIAFIRSKGGDVIMSFGGAAGTELGVTDPDPAKVEAKYQAVIDEYKLSWIDMDIEGKAIHDAAANHVRNTALVNLQKKNSGLIVVYTLAADPNGIEPQGLATLRDANEQGLKVEAVNLMTMDYGREMSVGKKMGDLAITTVLNSYNQMQKIDPTTKIGITPDIGINDEATEIFGLEDAKIVMDWAKDKPYVRLLAFWVLQRDRANGKLSQDTASGIKQNDWDFNNSFHTFTTGFAPAK